MDNLLDDNIGKLTQRTVSVKDKLEFENVSAPEKKTDEVGDKSFDTIALMFLSLLLDLLAFTMILPLMPSLLDYYNKEEGQGNNMYATLLRAVQGFQRWTGAPDRYTSVLFGGALGSMYSLLQFLTSPIVGSLSDAYGRKPMLLICLDNLLDDNIGKLTQRTVSVKDKLEFENVSAPEKKTDEVGDKSFDTIALMFLSLLLDLLAFTMILPLMPSLLDYYNKEEGQGNNMYATLLRAVQGFQRWTGAPDRYTSVLFGGALGSMYSLLQFLTSPIVGSLSDAYGRKPMLLICLTGIALSHALWRYASTFSVFVLARFIGGLSKANVSVCMAIVTDASSARNRARGMALIGLAFSIGFIAGPLAGAWFAKTSGPSDGPWGERVAFYALSLSLANIALVFYCMPETLDKKKRAPLSFTLSKSLDFVSPWHLLKFTAVNNLSPHQHKVMSRLGLIYFLYLYIYSGLEFTITFLTHHVFEYTAMQQGKMFLVIGVIMAVLQGGAARRLGGAGAGRAARGALALTAPAFLAVALAATAQPPGLPAAAWLWLGLVLYAISTAFAVSCMSTMVAAQSPAEAHGAAFGTLRSLGALARGLGPLHAASVYWYFGAATTYSIGAAILIVPAVMLLRLKT